ncbi:glycosyltransferase family 4 protein [Geofilum rubicundum]|uniref:Glycosyltransferase, group 1 family protein n=1 Tax=Geofilum rubicundum JCM 15548 TaxID=1236989 RepID=A0A0E9M1W0_9BACT|nr:glycosyltransferase family 4 protein [Geofilum rubicundum]GAO31484.1 glycosyltransferase, group 1 family protein [Geofilum rubicundum JCM 15548]
MVRVCFVVSSLVNEGPVRVLLNIIRYIDFEKFEVLIVTLKDEGKESILSDFLKFPIKFQSLSVNDFRDQILLFWKLKRVLHFFHPDIVHSHCPRSLILVMLIYKSRFVKVHTVHSLPGPVDKALYGEIVGGFVARLVRFSLKRIDLPIACGANLGQQLVNHFGIDSISIRNGADFELFTGGLSDKERQRSNLKLVPKLKYFVWVGRFSAEKNPLFLVEQFNSIQQSDLHLLMIGDGPLLEQAKLSAGTNITVLGFKTNVRDYLVASDFFVSSSITEGMPNAVLEAMAVGLPLLLSDIPSHREIICSSKKQIGFLFKENDSIDFEQKALSLTNGEFFAIEASVVIDCFKSQFTAKEMSDKYQQKYLKLV